MSALDIPGFFYDIAKRKYFKIQPHHVAPSGSQYSQEIVQRYSEGQKVERSPERRPICIERSLILNHPSAGGLSLGREINYHPRSRFPNGEYATWAQGLVHKPRITKGIEKFLYDEAGKGICMSHSADPNACSIGYADDVGQYAVHMPFWYADSEITSLKLSPDRVVMITTMGNDHVQSSLMLMKLPDPGHTRDGGSSASEASAPVGQRIQVTNLNCWASSTNPDTSDSQFAVAAGFNAILVTQREGHWGAITYDSPVHSDLLAVDWLDPRTLLCGCRNGKTILWDTRFWSRDASSTPIWGPPGIGHVRALNSNRIAISGVRNQLNVYDLRYLKSFPTTVDDSVQTIPFLTFPSYRNRSTPGYKLGFDIHASSSIIAAGSDTGSKCQMFDGGTGKELFAGALRNEADKEKDIQPATCVQFIERSGEKLSLMVSSPAGMEEWCW